MKPLSSRPWPGCTRLSRKRRNGSPSAAKSRSTAARGIVPSAASTAAHRNSRAQRRTAQHAYGAGAVALIHTPVLRREAFSTVYALGCSR